MARNVITANTLAESTFQVDDGGVAISTTNDAEIAAAVVANADRYALMLRFDITACTNGDTITVVEGDGFRSGLGNMTKVCVTGAQTVLLGPLETARFKIQNAITDRGKIYINYAGTSIAGMAHLYLVPK